jgi:hypothetical protein
LIIKPLQLQARAVKIIKNTHRRRNHDKWWTDLRDEVRGHAIALNCQFILGYTETATILDGTLPFCIFFDDRNRCIL